MSLALLRDNSQTLRLDQIHYGYSEAGVGAQSRLAMPTACTDYGIFRNVLNLDDMRNKPNTKSYRLTLQNQKGQPRNVPTNTLFARRPGFEVLLLWSWLWSRGIRTLATCMFSCSDLGKESTPQFMRSRRAHSQGIGRRLLGLSLFAKGVFDVILARSSTLHLARGDCQVHVT